MDSERYFEGEVGILLVDGSRETAMLTADAIILGRREIYRLVLSRGSGASTVETDIDFFETMIKLRLDLEREGALLCCFGASENVYPSSMARQMGAAILAYRMRLGAPALQKDLVNIFETDETVVPATVAQQEDFRQRWYESLRVS